MTRDQTQSILGMQSYLHRYGQCDPQGPNLREHLHEFDDWQMTIPFKDEPVDIICCPEDRECSSALCLQGNTCCRKCQLPICRECKLSFFTDREIQMPPAALANDMMIFYAPSELYTHDVTAMEMICASVCLTSMICFTLEAKYRKENPFDSEFHMKRHRMGAPGNATSFPSP